MVRAAVAFALLAGCTVDAWTYRARDAGSDASALDRPPDAAAADVPDDEAAAPDAPPDDAPDAAPDAPPDDAPLDAPLDAPDAPLDAPPDVEPPPPRLLWPLSGARLTGRSPTLRWTAAAAAVTLERCADRACARVVDAVAVTGGAHTLRDLAPGAHWWRVRAGERVTPVWLFFAARQSPPVTRAAGVAPDFDADGFADLAVGAFAYDFNDGAVFVHPGSPRGVAPTAAVTLRSPEENAQFGERLTCGDVDGDGYVDLAVGARFAGAGAGAVFVYRGGPGGLGATPSQRLPAPAREREFGAQLSAQGDFDGDGYADLVALGSLSRNFTVGPGSPAGVRWGADAITSLPGVSNCHSAPPLVFDGDDDGRDDVGCFEHGTATPPRGPTLRWFRGAPLAAGPAASVPHRPDAESVRDTLVAGDLDGDGRPELVLTAAGALFVLPLGERGPDASRASSFTNGDAAWGRQLAAGDLDGDGRADLVVTAIDTARPTPSEATACLSRSGGCRGAPTLRSAITSSGYAFGVAAAVHDLDGDGFGEAIVGGSTSTSAVSNRVEIFAGAMAGPAPAPTGSLAEPWTRASSFGESLLR
jgi:hypothetical protein